MLRYLAILLLAAGSTAAVYADTVVNIAPAKGCFSNSGECTTGAGTTAEYDSGNMNLLEFTSHNADPKNIETTPFFYTVDLGRFNAKDLITTTLNGTFSLTLTFALPDGTTPDPWSQAATVTGTIHQHTDLSIFIDFDNSSHPFNYAYDTGSGTHIVHHTGTFYIDLQDVTLSAANPNAGVDSAVGELNADITSSPVPEPGSLALFGSGLAALVGFVRRTKR